MILNVAGVVIFLSVCGVVASNPDRAVDCRKFVFAPLCRGVAAKRGTLDIGRYGQDVLVNDEKLPLTVPHSAISFLGALRDESDGIDEMTDRRELRRLARMYQRKRRNGFSRTMFGNSERDNFPTQELKHL